MGFFSPACKLLFCTGLQKDLWLGFCQLHSLCSGVIHIVACMTMCSSFSPGTWECYNASSFSPRSIYYMCYCEKVQPQLFNIILCRYLLLYMYRQLTEAKKGVSHGGLVLLANHRKRERLRILLDILRTLKTLVSYKKLLNIVNLIKHSVATHWCKTKGVTSGMSIKINIHNRCLGQFSCKWFAMVDIIMQFNPE